DLKRSWRFVMPNLENCALLTIDYKYLFDEAKEDNNWIDVPYLNHMDGEERYEFLKNTLDFMRTSKAINHSFFYENRDVVENNIRERLKEDWGLDKGEKIEIPNVMRFVSLGKTTSEPTVSMGIQSQWGKYVKSIFPFDDTVATFEDFCNILFHKLKGMTYIKSKSIKGEKGTTDGYLLNATSILWKLGNGNEVSIDPVRIRTANAVKLKPNDYFKSIYEYALRDFKNLKSAEHTGQIGNADRIVREDLFRKGIDIKDLSIVHLRNVPPSPANYAQRSGRAGRSGQGALVLTYCSQYSPHDRNYFSKKENMVSGVVKPPRIDITNDELAQAHINAIYLMVAGLDFNKSVKEIIDLDSNTLPLKSDVHIKLHNGHNARKSIVAKIASTVLGFSPETIKEQRQLELWIDQIPDQFDQAFDRWRKLYIQANEMILEARAVKDNPIYSAKSNERLKAFKDEKFGLNLKDSLLNDEVAGQSNTLSEFYPYRYLAAEGFLPGYNFTKLPNRVMLRKGSDNVELIERPRMISITEFGPRNIIYHNGATYEINRIIQDNNKVATSPAKVSKNTGYIMMGDEYNRETCPI
ncbi:MAG TPA: helicase-related protein, partial [Saprospiraceae bacterium]|nr:helicase-related protein [Saprospiraceae bacterium]